MTWDWSSFQGSAEMLKFMRRDLAYFKSVVADVPQRRVAIQAGGAIGMYPKFLSERFQVTYTFEPDPENFLTMCHNAPERNIVKFQAALGCDRLLVSISHERRSKKPGRAHEGIRHVSGTGLIPTMRIDDLQLPVCDLIQLDIEGHELFALRGAEQTIRRCRPVIVLEINEMCGYVGVTEPSIRAQMTAFGYRDVRQIGASDHLFLPVAVPEEVAC